MSNKPNNSKTMYILLFFLCCCCCCCCSSSSSLLTWMGYVPGTTAAYNRDSGTWDIMWDHGTNIKSANSSGVAASNNDSICTSINDLYVNDPAGYDDSTSVFAITGFQTVHTDADGEETCFKTQDSYMVNQYGESFCSDYSSVEC